MDVKIPGFDLNIKVIWVIIAFAWHALFGAALWYVGYKISQFQIEHKIEKTTVQVGGLTTTFQDRIKVTDGRFEKLETGQEALNEKVTTIQGDVKGMSKQVDNLVVLVSALLRDRVAETATIAHPVAYEVTN